MRRVVLLQNLRLKNGLKFINMAGYTYTTTDGKTYFVQFGENTACTIMDCTVYDINIDATLFEELAWES